jgi:hypothetical protein
LGFFKEFGGVSRKMMFEEDCLCKQQKKIDITKKNGPTKKQVWTKMKKG